MYPEDVGDGAISEFWQVPNGRWLELPQDKLVPSVLHKQKRFYIHEIAELADGTWVIPQLWLTFNNQLHGDCLTVSCSNNIIHVHPLPVRRAPIAEFSFTHDELILSKRLEGCVFSRE